MAKKGTKAPKPKEVSELVRRKLYQFNEPDGEVCAEVNVEMRQGCLWLTSLWVKHTYRKQGLARKLVAAAVSDNPREDLYLHVMAFEGRPLSDQKLTEFYGSFGFQPTTVGGILMRRANS